MLNRRNKIFECKPLSQSPATVGPFYVANSQCCLHFQADDRQQRSHDNIHQCGRLQNPLPSFRVYVAEFCPTIYSNLLKLIVDLVISGNLTL